jgi:glycosyltransferase involved in cell wall biosynthesis
MRRLLLITYTFPPDNAPAAARPGQLFKYLPEHGYRPFVVAASTYGHPIGDERVRRVPTEKTCPSVLATAAFARWFTRFCAPYEDHLDWVPHAAAAATDIVGAQQIDAIFSTSPFLASHFVALWLKARLNLPWVADFQDPIRDNPFRDVRWIYPYDSIVEGMLFRYADQLMANTDTVASAWRERYPRLAGKISVLWNCFDPLENINSGEPPSRSFRLLAHVGSLYGGRHPRQLLTSIDRLGISPAVARVKLVGPIHPTLLAAHGPLFERLREKGLLTYGNITVPRDEAMRETAEADYLVLLDINNMNASFQLPSKLLDYVRCGKPILAYTPTASPVERILSGSGIPYVAIDPSAPDSVSDSKLLEFLKLPTTQRRPTPWFEKTFSARTQAQFVSEQLDRLILGGLSRKGFARHEKPV